MFITVSLLLTSFFLLGEVINNIEIQEKIEAGLIRYENSDDITIYNYKAGSPAIPLVSYHFEIPNGKKLESVVLLPKNIEVYQLNATLMKAPTPVNNSDSKVVSNEAFQGTPYTEYLVDFTTNQSGPYRFGTVSFYSALYDNENNSIAHPQSFELEWVLAEGEISSNPNNNSSSLIAQELDLISNRVFTVEKLLYIATDEVLTASADLLRFRREQGYEVFTESVSNILATTAGIDDAAKLKNYITNQYMTEGIDYVTLAGDYDIVPYRWAWAFDCEFGMNVLENEIPADMYFACLDNDWDENQNGIYGEDEDNPDYYPELFVSRIGFHNASEVTDYTTKLLEYEKGTLHQDSNYNTSVGLSTNLWSTSNSVLSQEYILDHYFPSYYSNVIYNEEENTVNNFVNVIQEMPNIIQHTGHAFHSIMGLDDGYISIDVSESLNQQATTGIFYSIGCWAGAYDFPSIGESLQLNAPVLGFLCNSRYGWGAPAADGFGFSEYFQKEFFRQYFEQPELTLSALNSIQKLPFLPYMSGDSVYKWVAYEMNALGDACFRPMRNNQRTLTATVEAGEDLPGWYLAINVSSNGVQVPDAVVMGISEWPSTTNSTGTAMYIDGLPVSVYKYGYEYTVCDSIGTDAPLSIRSAEAISLTLGEPYNQNSSYRIDAIIDSHSDQTINYWVEILPEFEEYFAITEQFVSGTIVPNSYAFFNSNSFHIEPTTYAPQFTNGYVLNLTMNVYDMADESEPACSLPLEIVIKAPELVLHSAEPNNLPLQFNGLNTMSFVLENVSDTAIETPIELEFLSDIPVSRVGYTIPNGIEAYETIEFDVDFMIENDGSMFKEVPFTFSYDFNNQPMQAQFVTVYPTELIGNSAPYWDIDFNSVNPEITIPAPWQIVNEYGEDCLSCRPSNFGDYDFTLPQMYWLPGLEMSFDYTYRMPMYGEDGISFIISGNDWSEEIMFLGSGGALSRENGYIFSDWASYSLMLDDLLTHELDYLEPFNVTFNFSSTDGDVIPDYLNDPLVGVFVDNLEFELIPTLGDETDDVPSSSLLVDVYPNPVNDVINFKVNSAEPVVIELFNIKGQKILKKILDKQSLKSDFSLDLTNLPALSNSGIYLYKVETSKKVQSGKFIIVR